MKKKKLKNFELNKRSISKLNEHITPIDFVKGGHTASWLVTNPTACDIIISLANGTDGDCVNTWGDNSCPTGWDGICVADNNDNNNVIV